MRYASAKMACDSLFPGHRTVRLHQWSNPESPSYHYGSDYVNWGMVREDTSTGLRVCVKIGQAAGWSLLLADLLLYASKHDIAVCSHRFYAMFARLAYDAFRAEPNDRFFTESCCHYRHREGDECPGIDQETHMQLIGMRFGVLRCTTQVQIGMSLVSNLRDCRYNSGCMTCNADCGCSSCDEELCLMCLCRGRGDPCPCKRGPLATPQTHAMCVGKGRWVPIEQYGEALSRVREMEKFHKFYRGSLLQVPGGERKNP